ncbi:DUF1653 domain-containing protein [Enterocloster sp.]|uniref:DUF1653 domain-containing protein n=1 Tax=Enterocloster sp. TaxID=2719315 RepID=UPI003AF062B8
MYQVRAVAVHSETGEPMVVYQALYGTFGMYVRPLEMFMSPVDREKYPDADQEYRFERVWPENDPVRIAWQEREQGETDKEEELPGPWLERFLDALRPEDKLAVLKQMEGKATKRELDCMFMAMDLKPEPEMPVEEQIQALRRYVQLLRRYDGTRLR